jgi:sulfide:quinone oxidoreductase
LCRCERPPATREEARPDPRRGLAGLELAARLSDSLANEVTVTLLDKSDSFHFGFSKLEVMLGRQRTADVRLHYRDIAKDGVEFGQENVTAIKPEARRVTTDKGSYDADILVVALGAEYDFAATPGFEEGGLEYYSLGGAQRLRGVLTDFDLGQSSSRSWVTSSNAHRPVRGSVPAT